MVFLRALLIGTLISLPEAHAAATESPGSVEKKPVRSGLVPSRKQEPVKVNQAILDRASIDPLSIVVSLSKQRVYLQVGGKVAIDSPISSGKRSGWTPKGEFSVLEKDPDHQSTLYGDFVDGSGRKVKSGVSTRVDSAPSGTHFRGASMKFFMRLTPQGVGMHAGFLPGYPASHGCIRLPLEAAKMIYGKVGINTPVTVTD